MNSLLGQSSCHFTALMFMNNKRRILKDYRPEMSDLERRLPSCFGWRPLSVPQVCVGEMTEGLIVGTPVFCYRAKPKGGTQQNTQSQNCCYDNYLDPLGHFVWKLYWQKRGRSHSLTNSHKHNGVHLQRFCFFFLSLTQEKKIKTSRYTNTPNNKKVLDKRLLMRLSLSREEGLPQLLELL